MKKKILIALAILLSIAIVFCAIYLPESNLNNTIAETQNIVVNEIQEIEKQNEVIVSEETEEIVRDTIQATEERRRFIYNRNY